MDPKFMSPAEKLERALNFQMQLVDSMKGQFDNFQSRVSGAVVDELIDVLKLIKTEELAARILKDKENRKPATR